MTINQLRERLSAVRASFESGNARSDAQAWLSEVNDLKRSTFAEMDTIMTGARTASRDLLASEQRSYDSLEAVFNEADDLLTRANTVETGPVFSTIGERDDNPELREAFRGYLRTGETGELRALSVGVDSEGGYTAPDGFRSKIVERMKAYGGVAKLAEVITTSDGTDLPWATNDDTANDGTGVQDENTQVAEQDLVFGENKLGAYMYPSGVVRASLQLIEDNAVDLESYLARKLGERIGRKQAPHFVTGTGNGQPQGLVTGGTVGKEGAIAAVTYDDLVDLVHSVDPAYREDADSCAWLMNDQTFAVLRKLTDSTGRPLIEPDVKRGLPNSILGYRVQIDQGFANIGAGAKPIAFGNIREGYVVRNVKSVSVLRLVERYADFLQHGFIAYQRADGRVQDAQAFKLFGNAAA